MLFVRRLCARNQDQPVIATCLGHGPGTDQMPIVDGVETAAKIKTFYCHLVKPFCLASAKARIVNIQHAAGWYANCNKNIMLALLQRPDKVVIYSH